MKKTIIAAAIAASVAAPAFAEVSISGMMNPEWVKEGSDYDLSDSANNSTAAGPGTGVNTDLVFQSSEDLGNGLKAGVKYHIFHDHANSQVADLSASLSGDFGTIIAGRFEPFSESTMDAWANIDASHDLDLEDNDNAIGRQQMAAAYVSPSINGLTVAVASVTVDGDGNGNTDLSEATEMFAKYTNGALTVMASNTAVDQGNEITSFGGGYKMGDLEVRVMSRQSDDGAGASADSLFYGAKYTMGANTIAAGVMDKDAADSDSNIISFSHALSKNTNVYVVQKNNDAGIGDNQTAVGMAVKF